MQDKQGREYAKLSELKPGDIVQVDTGFDCLPDNAKRVVVYHNGLCVTCQEGYHNLEGQLHYDDEDTLIGVYKL